jgi:hypothetical protein
LCHELLIRSVPLYTRSLTERAGCLSEEISRATRQTRGSVTGSCGTKSESEYIPTRVSLPDVSCRMSSQKIV